ncbi:MAG: hypothetical protein A3I21_00665 [Candidatus Zambryskibacteria bacterium RIFCSPLOWO2_02_FULL_39_69]|uniref:Type II secretion system protein GspF domain-containing protein n=2 Tax=Candidatus Zambryskiibacteriota TaxID=1817925 RepID=A0A1G2T756_9BACT|nr:MAG: Type IV pilin [Parcubacteria group bacterium GW2011_GWA2_40_14]OHA93094.1 MAG: hypothetical protein A2W58_03405 [Candidatus Zambryskibacteria bacterium RIFCSPHIGHO2_02_38_10.5]OHA95686.1 MAG: hypothetical protein A3C63_00395 [Candidatus Zambryskibacteria bacterium RIFCSPHIGHO2_02_FULL_39_82]OHA98590.1 MAG: hypothetical protein A3E32_03570 [Candidatus Zambryskibacteria bacterium RIFCSPHIGHO2_12_FULL_38_37]OHB09206.1 MAG: hypothetical protein A2W64_01540 [Candidatus Zambryskibacteria bact
MLFHYKALDSTGKEVEANLEAKDRFALYHAVKKDGNTVIFTEEVKAKGRFSLIKLLPFLDNVTAHDKIIFARNLSKMILAGLPITRALSIMERQARGGLKSVLKNLSESVGKGTTLSESMKNFPDVFSTLFTSMVRAGEESGNLATSLENVGMQMEKTYQLNRKIRGAMLYPAIILLLMVAIGILMMVYMVPTLTATFIGLNLDLPVSTRIIIFVSNFLAGYFTFFILGVVVTTVLLVFAFRSDQGKRLLEAFLLRLPIIGEIVKEINSARTARTLSSLLSSGVDIVLAVGVTKDVIQNSYYKKVLEEVQINIQKGEAISSVFSSHIDLYPIFVGEMVNVGEETGKIAEMLSNVALFYEEEVDQKTKDISSLIEPFLMIFIGLAVGFFAMAVISPIYSLGDSIQ